METVVECCEPLLEEPLEPEVAERLAEWFGVLADPTRIRLLSLISSKGEACAACDLVDDLDVSQPTVSHHLKVLREAGLVDKERRGRWIYYWPVPESLDVLSRALGGGR